jgi:transcriptional regulator with XRE-family HTH domain
MKIANDLSSTRGCGASTLRALREAMGLTQDELAQRIEITQSQLSKMERRDDHRISTLRRYVEALGGSLEICALVNGKRVKLAEG